MSLDTNMVFQTREKSRKQIDLHLQMNLDFSNPCGTGKRFEKWKLEYTQGFKKIMETHGKTQLKQLLLLT